MRSQGPRDPSDKRRLPMRQRAQANHRTFLLCSRGLWSFGLWSFGLWSFGLWSQRGFPQRRLSSNSSPRTRQSNGACCLAHTPTSLVGTPIGRVGPHLPSGGRELAKAMLRSLAKHVVCHQLIHSDRAHFDGNLGAAARTAVSLDANSCRVCARKIAAFAPIPTRSHVLHPRALERPPQALRAAPRGGSTSHIGRTRLACRSCPKPRASQGQKRGLVKKNADRQGSFARLRAANGGNGHSDSERAGPGHSRARLIRGH